MVIGYSFFRMPVIKRYVGDVRRNAVHFIIVGLLFITVIAEYFSLIYKIGMIFHLVLLSVTILLYWRFRKDFSVLFKNILKVALSWEGLVYGGVILFFAFFTSRGDFHYDTGLYHAQAIRWLEEYGVVRGLGNLQRQFAYNSSYHSFAAVFSFFWLLGVSLHTTTGFLGVVLAVYASRGLKGILKRKQHYADLCRLGLLLYLLNVLYYIMSPASDYGVLLLVAYLFLRWMEVYEHKGTVYEYALLCVLAVFAVTVKLSAATVVVLAIFPIFVLCKAKEWRRIAFFVGMGVVVLLPYLLRNVILSGFLLYPFSAIDLFNFDWKIPLDIVSFDNADIIAGARKITRSEIDLPLREWLPRWWEGQERYHRMLIYANILGLGLAVFNRGVKIFMSKRTKPGDGAVLAAYFALVTSLVLWFLMAPFVRYGLAFLLLMPALAVGESLSMRHNGFTKIIAGVMAALVLFSISPYWDGEITALGVFAKREIAAPYYIMPKDYDRPDATVLKIGEYDFFMLKDCEFLGYYNFPGSTNTSQIMRCELRGDTIQQGFRAN